MKSRLIHSVCQSPVLFSGSRNQPIYSCKKCGILKDGELVTQYQCIECKKWFLEDDGNHDINDEGAFFNCDTCKTRKIQST